MAHAMPRRKKVKMPVGVNASNKAVEYQGGGSSPALYGSREHIIKIHSTSNPVSVNAMPVSMNGYRSLVSRRSRLPKDIPVLSISPLVFVRFRLYRISECSPKDV